MSEILDIAGRPAMPDDVNKVAAEFEAEIQNLLQRYNGLLSPAYAAGILFWASINIHSSATTAMMMQNAEMMARMKDAAAKIPLQ